MNNNLSINKNTQIPQNEIEFFIIQKDENYKNSIEITFNTKTQIDIINLFLIIKSYSNNLIYYPIRFLIKIKDETKTIITFNKEISFFKKISYSKFNKWFLDQIKDDELYISKNSLYSFSIALKTTKDIENLKPIYPWSNEILNLYWKNLNDEIEYKEIIKKQEIYIKHLESIINNFKNK